MGCKTFPLEHVLNFFHALMRATSLIFSLDMGEYGCYVWLLHDFYFCWFCIVTITHVISVLRPKLLVISGADWRKPDPVTADSWVHLVRGCCPWVNACPWLCTWAVSLWPRPLCFDCMEKHHERSGWTITFSMCVTAFTKPFLYLSK